MHDGNILDEHNPPTGITFTQVSRINNGGIDKARDSTIISDNKVKSIIGSVSVSHQQQTRKLPLYSRLLWSGYEKLKFVHVS